MFPIFSPSIDSISIVRSGQVRRAKLYYLRDLTGKKARIVERIRKKQPDLASLYIDESEEVVEEEPKSPMVPKSRLDEVLAKNKEMQKKLQDIEKQDDVSETEVPQYDFVSKEKEYQDLVLSLIHI